LSTPIRNRRGDIHPPTGTPLFASRDSQAGKQLPKRRDLALSSEPDLAYPSSGPDLTVQAPPTENPDEPVKVIWGTNVSITESMQHFKDFLRNFKVKYRVHHDQVNNVANPVQVSRGSEDRELYRDYLRTMRLTSQTNLNLDAINLLAYPTTRKLYSQLAKYPQELVPIMDQALKDCMFAFAEEDQADEEQSGDREAAQRTIEDLNDMAARVYMVRPFGYAAINMRQLNPSGESHCRHSA
jgi:DNA replication licensing factor MCM4